MLFVFTRRRKHFTRLNRMNTCFLWCFLILSSYLCLCDILLYIHTWRNVRSSWGFFSMKGKEILGTRLLAKSIRVTRKHVKTCLTFFSHCRFDGSNNLNVWDYRNLAAGGKRTEDNVFLNCIGWKVLTEKKVF